ncbi:spore coat U domain-containing protein [Morganella morganii]|uniref:Csu type fimbrial protein n=1 Tax=Morganella morganii TaxID=582 RepID=UPI0009A81604|nr:spore coat U domain-containing protein [Morganella morganii]OPL23715.1 hypothetical protein B5S45_14275 [Morganella morganii]HCQ8178163.1 spore coat protein U domain-containing protein [Morganella morganii]
MLIKNSLRVLLCLISFSPPLSAGSNCWNGGPADFNFGAGTQGQGNTTTGKVVFTCNNYESTTRYIRACLRLQDEAPLSMRTNSYPAYQLFFNIYPLNDQSAPLSRSAQQYAQIDYTLPPSSTQEAYFNLSAKIIPDQTSLAAQSYYNYNFMAVIKFMAAEKSEQLPVCNAMPDTNIRTAPLSARTEIRQGCRIDRVSDMNFGALSPVSGKQLSSKTTATITAQCPAGTAFFLGLGSGLHYKDNSRQLCDGKSCVTYQLYQDAAGSAPWGDSVHVNTVSMVSDTGSSQSATVYGVIPQQNWPDAGTYTDTVVVTLFY